MLVEALSHYQFLYSFSTRDSHQHSIDGLLGRCVFRRLSSAMQGFAEPLVQNFTY